MSRAQDSFSIPVSVDDAHAVCIEAAGKDGWRIQDSDLEHFYLRQNVTLFDRLYKYPSDCAIFLHKENPRLTRVELHGRIRGFGPLQKRRVSHAIEKLRTAIESILETRPDKS
jgi:hypothetical protein